MNNDQVSAYILIGSMITFVVFCITEHTDEFFVTGILLILFMVIVALALSLSVWHLTWEFKKMNRIERLYRSKQKYKFRLIELYWCTPTARYFRGERAVLAEDGSFKTIPFWQEQFHGRQAVVYKRVI